ncbi:MAG: PBP1A family penicillin-binding protein [Thermoanaerobaculales bacterium]|nr:PBP1A family penicillin-binding protein [Thermoanaerobaculales bacterium]
MIKKKVVSGKNPAPRSITAAFRRLTSGSGWISYVTLLLWAGVVGCLVGAFAGWIIAQFLHVPQVDLLATFEPAATTRIYAADGEQVASYALEQRVVLGPEEIPDHFKHAVVAIEDADFYKHGGVDPQAVMRAAWYSVVDRKIGSRGGASTLTQQLALNLFLKRERTLGRKIKEALLALDIEKRYSKDQILTMYANQIFLGHGAYGVEAAAELYFQKPAIDLSLAEAALLAGMIPSANNKYDPIKRPENALTRRNKVLSRMLERGFIDAVAYEEAISQPLGVTLHRERVKSGAYFLEMTRQEIERRYGTDALYTSGLQVHLTMDPLLQFEAEKALREGLVNLEMTYIGYRRPPNVLTEGGPESVEDYDHPSWEQLELVPGAMVRAVVREVSTRQADLRIGTHTAELRLDSAKWTRTNSLKRILKTGDLILVRLPDPLPDQPEGSEESQQDVEPLVVDLLQEPEVEGALVAMDNRSGAILALVGGFDFQRSEFNRAVQSSLQCGSAFKPFVYLTAFEHGFTPADTLFDAPFLLADGTGELTYCPKNYYEKYYGITTLRKALELSYNASAVKLQQLAGSRAVVETARKFGISTELHPYPSLALGSLGVRLIDLVRAYSGIANLGEVPEPYFIAEIFDRDERLQERHFPHSERVMPEAVTYLALYMLRGVVEHGTGVSARWLDANLAGKTGTTDMYSDAWFVGFSPRITVGVWVGRDVKAPIGKKMTGAKAAQPIWNNFMTAYLETLTAAERAEDFQVPAGVVFTPVDATTGERAVPPCSYQKNVILEAFLDGTEPVDPCNEEMGEIMDLPWPFQLPYYTAKPGEPMPTFGAVEIADERLRPTPTPEEQRELDRIASTEGVEAAERYRLKMGVRKPEPEETQGLN